MHWTPDLLFSVWLCSRQLECTRRVLHARRTADELRQLSKYAYIKKVVRSDFRLPVPHTQRKCICLFVFYVELLKLVLLIKFSSTKMTFNWSSSIYFREAKIIVLCSVPDCFFCGGNEYFFFFLLLFVHRVLLLRALSPCQSVSTAGNTKTVAILSCLNIDDVVRDLCMFFTAKLVVTARWWWLPGWWRLPGWWWLPGWCWLPGWWWISLWLWAKVS